MPQRFRTKARREVAAWGARRRWARNAGAMTRRMPDSFVDQPVGRDPPSDAIDEIATAIAAGDLIETIEPLSPVFEALPEAGDADAREDVAARADRPREALGDIEPALEEEEG